MSATSSRSGKHGAAAARARCALAVTAVLTVAFSACTPTGPKPDTDASMLQPMAAVPPPEQLETPAAAEPAPAPLVPVRPESQPVVRLVAEPGLYRCELSRRVLVRRVEPDGGALVLNWQGRDYALKAVPARTGALRYESPRGELTWLVISGKSMLLDSKRGAQLANECRL